MSVKMELMLLMQELVEDRSMRQLLSPVPIPTTIPLLSACVASSKNVVAGPIRMLKSLSSDILLTLSDLDYIPTLIDCSLIITTLKDSAISLSACIYQCLCDSDVLENDTVTGMQGFSSNFLYKNSYAISGQVNQRLTSNQNAKPTMLNNNEQPLKIDSSPKSWPGVSSLSKLLEREQDLEAPKLKYLLFESLVAVYSSLLLNALTYYDASTLWRLLSQQWNVQMWNKLFGGGCVIQFKYKTQKTSVNAFPADDESAKQRLKMNARLGLALAANANVNQSEEKVYSREQFVPPELSMVNFFLARPDKNGVDDDYDSDDESMYTQKRDALDEDPETIHGKRYFEHMNPKSYSWCLMRYAIIKYSMANINAFLNVVGIETHELASLTPLTHQVLRTFEKWIEALRVQLNAFGAAPDDYIPGCNTNAQSSFSFTGPKILKYQSILDPANTPFM